MATGLESLKRLTFSQVEFLVDGFQFQQQEIKHYVLSHFHSDHTVGLTRRFSSGTIYCTEETGQMVEQLIGVDGKFIRTVPLGSTQEIGGVQMTFLDAGHCPGSAVIIFSEASRQRTVLHTGDFRAAAPVRDAVARWLGGCMVSELYLDTTYCSPRWSFPDQAVACSWMQALARREIEREPETLFIVGSYQIGKEKAAAAVAEAIGSSVFVDQRRWTTIKLAGLGTDVLPSGAPLWSIDKTDCHIWMLPLGGLGHDVLLQHLESSKGRFRSVVAFRPTGWSFTRAMGRVGLEAVRPWLDNNGHTRIYAVPYSEHSSFTELKAFVTELRPRRVVPTVNAATRAARERTVAPLLGLLDLRGDRERMDHYLHAGSHGCKSEEEDLDGLVDVLAMSADVRPSCHGPRCGQAAVGCDPQEAGVRVFPFLAGVRGSAAAIELDSDRDSDDEVALVVEESRCSSPGCSRAATCSSAGPADEELRQVSLEQQRRLLQYYEALQTQSQRRLAPSKPGKAAPGALQGARRGKKGKGRGKGALADSRASSSKPATIAAALGVKSASDTAQAAARGGKAGSTRRPRDPLKTGAARQRPKRRLQLGAVRKSEEVERRPTRFVPKPSLRVRERIDRAFAHRLYLLAHEEVAGGREGVWFDVLGSTGNVYRVTLAEEGSNCQCPDFAKNSGVCKHLLFVALRILKLDRDDHRVWQTSLTAAELKPLLLQLREGVHVGGVTADAPVLRGYQEARGERAGDGAPASRPLPADCPICYEEIGEGCLAAQAAETCRFCGHHLHVDCWRRWAASSPKGDACPLCRTPRAPPAPVAHGALRTVNLAAFSMEQQPSLQELYPETHQWITGRGA